MNQCERCGAILEPGETICKKCGLPVNSAGFSTGLNGQSNGMNPNNGNNSNYSLKKTIETTGSLNGGDSSMNNGNQMMPMQNNNPTSNSSKGGNKASIIVSIVVLIAALFLIFGNKLFGTSGDTGGSTDDGFELKTPPINNPVTNPVDKPTETPTEPDKPDTPTEPDKPDTPTEPDKPTPEPDQPSGATVNYGGYTFDVPDGCQIVEYEKDDGSTYLYLVPKGDRSWGASISIETSAYNQLRNRKDEVKAAYEKEGYTVNSIKEESVGSLSFLVAEMYDARNGNSLMGFTSAGTNKVFFVSVYTTSGELDYNKLNVVSDLIYKAKSKAQGN